MSAERERHKLKFDVVAEAEKKKDLLIETADYIWDHPELGFKEFQCAQKLQEVLRAEGFQLETGLGHITTAFSGRFGSGRPVIGILGEFDALMNLSQKAGVTHQESAGGLYGHGCGHNLLGVGSLGAALAVKAYLETTGASGTVIYFGCPAEENGSAKAFLARDGVFDALDAALSWHPADTTGVRNLTTLANCKVLYRFDGVAAHASIQPHLGRSALDAVELMADPALLEQARQEHRKRIGKGYICPIPPDVRPGTIPHGPQSTHTSVFSIHLLQLQQPSHTNRQWAANQQLTQ